MIRNVNYIQLHKNIKPQSSVQIRLTEGKEKKQIREKKIQFHPKCGNEETEK